MINNNFEMNEIPEQQSWFLLTEDWGTNIIIIGDCGNNNI